LFEIELMKFPEIKNFAKAKEKLQLAASQNLFEILAC